MSQSFFDAPILNSPCDYPGRHWELDPDGQPTNRIAETVAISKTGKALLQGRGPALETTESEGQMLQRVLPELMAMKNVVVLNDEAHHCYRKKPDDDDEALKGDERKEAEKNREAARLWISGLEAVQRKLGLARIFDLSATPFFLRGSGYPEGVLFPWTMSDFSLMDAIECGIAKLRERIAAISARLAIPHPRFAPEWIESRHMFSESSDAAPAAWRSLWALADAERLRLRSIADALAAWAYGLSVDEFAWLLSACDLPVAQSTSRMAGRILNPKGFWRVDKDKDPELRHTVLAQVAFEDLQRLIAECGGDRQRAITEFCGTGPDEGWQLPETLCLADYGLGHDERAKRPQPVASRLGPRFYDWQLEQTPEESWRECEIHARNILGEEGFARLKTEIAAERVEDRELPAVVEPSSKYGGGRQAELFEAGRTRNPGGRGD